MSSRCPTIASHSSPSELSRETATGPSSCGEPELGLDPRTGRVTARVRLGEHRPVRLSTVGEELWVTCQDGAVLEVASTRAESG